MGGFVNGPIQRRRACLWIGGDSTLCCSNTQGRLASRCCSRQFSGIAFRSQKGGGSPWSGVEKQSSSVLDFSRTRAAGHLLHAAGSAGPEREQLHFTPTGKVPISRSGPASRL